MTCRVVAAVFLASLVSPAAAQPSNLLVRTSGPAQLRVNEGQAEVRYMEGGVVKTLIAWGAINAQFPDQHAMQSRFKLIYGGRLAGGSCGAYDGPAIPYLVAACKASDGSYWALQRWYRSLPFYGQRAIGRTSVPDLRLSHWHGPLEVFTVNQDWAFRIYDHLYGSVTYRGRPMHGFGTNRFGQPRDRFGVLVYVDTFDSVYGSGWHRENGFVTHKPTGIFCYGFYRHVVPGARAVFPSGNGRRYRATVVGPGVLPDVRWEAPARGAYNRAEDRRANAEQRAKYTDKICHAN